MVTKKRNGTINANEILLVFAVASTVYIALGSHNPFAVDGAFRPAVIYRAQKPLLTGNEHLLYGLNIYYWGRLLSALGVTAANAMQFIRMAQIMNSLAAAGSLALLYLLCRQIECSQIVASEIVLAYGFSRAFFSHATNSAEPMVALFWAFLAVLLAVIAVTSRARLFYILSGVLLALSMATYQSMVLIGPAILILISEWPQGTGSPNNFRDRIRAVGLFLGGSATTVALIYGTAYYLDGTRGWAELFKRFFSVTGEQVYGGLSVTKIAAVPLGLSYALLKFLPPDCSGFRCLLKPENFLWLPLAIGSVLVTFLILGMFLHALWLVAPALSARDRLVLKCSLVGGLFNLAALGYWMPTYDKLWLEPLACLFVAVAVIAKNLFSVCDISTDAMALRLAKGASGFAIVIVCSSLATFLYEVRQPQVEKGEAAEVAGLVSPGDLVVIDWEPTALYYQYIWSSPDQVFNLPTQATLHGKSTAELLAGRIRSTLGSDHKVFFLGILDLSQSQWQEAVSTFHGPDFDELSPYRKCAVIVRRFANRATLRIVGKSTRDCATKAASVTESAIAARFTSTPKESSIKKGTIG